MKKAMRKVGKILLILLILLAVFLIVLTVVNQILLGKDREALKDHIGQMVEVDGHEMCVYTEGQGEHTVVFMSGSGTASPIYDFKTLWSRLTDEYRIVVIEKFGYGFSDVVDTERSFDTMLRQDREALSKLGIEGPFVLCPHSMSGIEALMWAQRYPDEVEAIVGLDMAVPEAYDVIDGSSGMIKVGLALNTAAREIGLFRLMGDDVLLNTAELTDEEISTYRRLIYTKSCNKTVQAEGDGTTEASAQVRNSPKPGMPMLLYLSDGSGGTGLDKNTWRGFTYSYTEGMDNAKVVELDCGHYVHDFEYERISREMKEFIGELG